LTPVTCRRDTKELRPHGLPEHVFEHFLTMAKLHAANRYDRLTHDSRGDPRQAGDKRP